MFFEISLLEFDWTKYLSIYDDNLSKGSWNKTNVSQNIIK